MFFDKELRGIHRTLGGKLSLWKLSVNFEGEDVLIYKFEGEGAYWQYAFRCYLQSARNLNVIVVDPKYYPGAAKIRDRYYVIKVSEDALLKDLTEREDISAAISVLFRPIRDEKNLKLRLKTEGCLSFNPRKRHYLKFSGVPSRALDDPEEARKYLEGLLTIKKWLEA